MTRRPRTALVATRVTTAGVPRTLTDTAPTPGINSVILSVFTLPLQRSAMPRYSSIEEVIASYPARFNPEKAQGVDDKVQMNLTGDGGGQWVLHVHDGQVDISEGTTRDPALTLDAPADVWLSVENGQTNPMMAVMSGKVKLRGSVPFATKFMGMFGGRA
jgi:putative sterol carrier protein